MFRRAVRSTQSLVQGLATQKMQMQMENGLPPVCIRVDHGAKSSWKQSLRTCDLRRDLEKPAEELCLARSTFRERGFQGCHMPLRKYKEMSLRLGPDIPDADEPLVFVKLRRRDLSAHDLAEDTISHGILSISAPSRESLSSIRS
jgi:hypothetical protein